MQYFPAIIPLFEASQYLSWRFSEERTSAFIQNLFQSGAKISDKKRTYFEKIVELEAELDALIEPDPIIEKYFFPLRTRSHQQTSMPLSIGSVLLSMPPDLERPFTYDSLVDFYRNAPEQKRLDLFYERLFPFFTDHIDKDSTMSGFISAVSSVLVEAEDKWAMIDCASNPCEHLELLRPSVTKAMALIEEKASVLADFIRSETEDFCSKDHLKERLRFLCNSVVSIEDLTDAELYPSIFVFNGLAFFSVDDSCLRVVFGLYLNTRYLLAREAADPSYHVKLLKMLSDLTRFNILHELCDRESYGQELADKFGGARSAIYYHLEKLLGYGLIDLEMTEYRMLYTMNKQNVYDKMNAIRDYLLNGWKPEDEPDADAETPETGGESGPEE